MNLVKKQRQENVANISLKCFLFLSKMPSVCASISAICLYIKSFFNVFCKNQLANRFLQQHYWFLLKYTYYSVSQQNKMYTHPSTEITHIFLGLCHVVCLQLGSWYNCNISSRQNDWLGLSTHLLRDKRESKYLLLILMFVLYLITKLLLLQLCTLNQFQCMPLYKLVKRNLTILHQVQKPQ